MSVCAETDTLSQIVAIAQRTSTQTLIATPVQENARLVSELCKARAWAQQRAEENAEFRKQIVTMQDYFGAHMTSTMAAAGKGEEFSVVLPPEPEPFPVTETEGYVDHSGDVEVFP